MAGIRIKNSKNITIQDSRFIDQDVAIDAEGVENLKTERNQVESTTKNKGGDGGSVFIVAKKIIGDGKILADGGEGDIGGKGGKVTLISEDHQFTGEVSAKGGHSLYQAKNKKWFERTWVQVIFLLAAIAGIVELFINYF